MRKAREVPVCPGVVYPDLLCASTMRKVLNISHLNLSVILQGTLIVAIHISQLEDGSG